MNGFQDGRLYSIMECSSSTAIAHIFRVLLPDARSILDVTYGSGTFWKNWSGPEVTRLDIDPARRIDIVGSYHDLPVLPESFDVVVFDPPYQTDVGKAKASVMAARFGQCSTIPVLRASVQEGCRQIWRVARLGVVVKCQDYIHASKSVWMSRWVQEVLGEPYDFTMVRQSKKMLDPKWSEQYSAWRNHATYWVFRKGDQTHKRR